MLFRSEHDDLSEKTFTITTYSNQSWQIVEHPTSAGWDKVTAAVTATNHSNAPVKVSFTYTPQGDIGVTASMDKRNFILAAGKEDRPDDADTNSAVLTIDDTSKPNNSVTAGGVTIGTITVTIEKQ